MTEDTEKNSQQSGESTPQDLREEGDQPQHDKRHPEDVNKDPSRKAPGQESERKDREGSEDLEKRRAS